VAGYRLSFLLGESDGYGLGFDETEATPSTTANGAWSLSSMFSLFPYFSQRRNQTSGDDMSLMHSGWRCHNGPFPGR
jgi:hypothetical protein